MLTQNAYNSFIKSHFIKLLEMKHINAALVQFGSLNACIFSGSLRESSIEMYERDFKAYVELVGSIDTALDATTLRHWRNELSKNSNMSPNTVNRMISAVKRRMKETANLGHITHEAALEFERVEGVKGQH
jgi:hypothetical protein